MKWSPQQEEALRGVSNWLSNGDAPFYYLAGYAGTGKTTLAKEFAAGVSGRVLFAAYTGKAAHVMRKKGCPGASTIHSLIYHAKNKCREHFDALQEKIDALTDEEKPVPMELRRAYKEEKANVSRPSFSLKFDSALIGADLLILDECSMVDAYIAKDLFSFDVPILVLGDPAQLPPVRRAGFFTAQEPSFMLTDVHRHALDSGVYRLATAVREGRRITEGDKGDGCIILRQKDLDDERLMGADQILVGKNVTRRKVNTRMRRVHGRWNRDNEHADLPWKGDKLVCLRNNHEFGLLNGSLWTATEVSQREPDTVKMKIAEEDAEGYSLEVSAHGAIFAGESLDHIPFYQRKDKEEFDYGYALTTHKAQGSQWEHVLILDESEVFRSQRRKWLYTAVTRAADKVEVVIK